MRIEDLPMAQKIWLLGLVMIFLVKIYSLAAPEGYPVLPGSYWAYVVIWAAIVLVANAIVGKIRQRPPEDPD